MLNFPVPYPDELIYSTVARAGIRFGITSPKRLLDEVFGSRTVIATADLPSHLAEIAAQYPRQLKLSVEDIAYKHTLFPLYAPFIPEDRRRRSLALMAHRTKGAVHVGLGFAASKVKARRRFRFCRGCLKDQLRTHGEYYWARRWQIAGVESCERHGSLQQTEIRFHNRHRHQFIPLTEQHLSEDEKPLSRPYSSCIEKHAHELLELPSLTSPAQEQWGNFYRGLAHKYGATRGSIIVIEKIRQAVHSRWPDELLTALGIPAGCKGTNWLSLIFRKHRKSFSFLQHIVVLEAMMEHEWSFSSVIEQVQKSALSKLLCQLSTPKQTDAELLYTKRREWLKLVKSVGTRNARLSGHEALYSWLRRHDQAWLRQTNLKHRKSTQPESIRVNWHNRDVEILARLEAVLHKHKDELEGPRRSRNWFCTQADCLPLMRRIHKLPLSEAFLAANSEDVPTYQIRRLRQTISNHGRLPLWKLLWASRLNEKRLKERTRQFLQDGGWM